MGEKITGDEMKGVMLAVAGMAVDYVMEPGIYDAFAAWLGEQEDNEGLIPGLRQLQLTQMYLAVESAARLGVLREALDELRAERGQSRD